MENDTREVDTITFGIYSADEIRNMAVCKVDNPKLCSNDKNSGYGTVYDPRMGTLENTQLCPTCGLGVWECVGHFGYIELNESIIHPLYYKQVVSFLKCFCIKCYKLMITEEQVNLNNLNKAKGVKRFNKILERLEKIDICTHCFHPQPHIKHTIADNTISMIYKDKEKGKISITLQVDEIKKIFDNISNSDIVLLGFDPNLMKPSNLILTVFPVIPTAARPYVIAEGNMCDDDLTIQLVEIIKANNHLEQTDGIPISDTKKQKYLQSLKFRISTFYNNSSGKAKHSTNGRAIKGIKERLTGKEGMIRGNLMGKRCIFMGTKILLWTGETKNVEDIKIGDVLIGNDGEKRTVLKLFNGVDQMYKIKQESGIEYIVNSEHILTFKYIDNKQLYWVSTIESWEITWFDKNTLETKSKQTKVPKNSTKEETYEKMKEFVDKLDNDNTVNISVLEYLKLPEKTKKLLYGYKIEKPVNWEYKEVEIDPYILGMWLGRQFTTIDPELVEYWRTWDEKNGITGKLEKYGLLNNKHIPKDYIINSKEVRLALLAGLIDTDGSVEQGGVTVRISQCEEHKDIIEGAKFIADSLGFQTTSWTNKGESKKGTELVLSISGNGLENIPTLLERKKCRSPLIQGNNWTKITVEPYKVDEFYGFEIDGNNLFVLPDFTVLHNCEMTGRTVIGPDPTLKMGQLAVPPQMASNLTIPVHVTNFNYDYLTDLVNSGKVNYILKDNGKVRINLENALFFKGTRINHGDIIVRKDEKTGKEYEIYVTNGKELLKYGDKLKRNGEWVTDIKYPEKRTYKLEIGDICERQLQDGDVLLLNLRKLI